MYVSRDTQFLDFNTQVYPFHTPPPPPPPALSTLLLGTEVFYLDTNKLVRHFPRKIEETCGLQTDHYFYYKCTLPLYLGQTFSFSRNFYSMAKIPEQKVKKMFASERKNEHANSKKHLGCCSLPRSRSVSRHATLLLTNGCSHSNHIPFSI